MINGLGIVGWGVGGIEAEAGMLGQPVYFLTPDVVGVHLTGALARRRHGHRPGADGHADCCARRRSSASSWNFTARARRRCRVVDRATIANMAPEYGATMGFFPIDAECVNYLRATGRSEEHCKLYENYYKAQGLFGIPKKGEIRIFAGRRTGSEHRRAERRRAETSAGPDRTAEAEERIHQRVFSKPVTENGFGKKAEELSRCRCMISAGGEIHPGGGDQENGRRPAQRTRDGRTSIRRPTPIHATAPQYRRRRSRHGSVLIAAITSCTNTSRIRA